MTDLTFSESVVVDTDPDTLYGLVSDVTNMGRWSPQCKECWWEDEDGGPVAGAWFKGRNEAGGRTWETRSQVVVAEPVSTSSGLHFQYSVLPLPPTRFCRKIVGWCQTLRVFQKP